ncbi:MAG TPA: peptide chain release factor 2 [Arenicellales bacterium]|nr:peptide chain release factor 2 [Arenicellales bacterium]
MFDFDSKKEQLEEVDRQLEQPDVWNEPERAQELGQTRARLARVVHNLEEIRKAVADAADLVELAREESDPELLESVEDDLGDIDRKLAELEFQRMFSGPMDASNAFVDIQAGSGGTEAQDWAEMLLRMYLRYCENKQFETELIEVSEGDVAGIKSATVKVSGEYAFGFLRTETGIHRLVRKSPFDSGHRRHTSFASVYVYPEIDEQVEVEINPADLRIDTYRASGAGGQHVNKTDSAVRITHMPTGIVVQCQSDRSQHRNRAAAMDMLRARLYEAEMQKRRAEQEQLEDSKADIGWGQQIRSYVLDQSRIKDLRTSVEVGDTQGVLDGNLDPFIEASLKAGL